VLSVGKPSSWSTQLLHRANLTGKYDADPEGALEEMRETLIRPSNS